MEIVWSSLAKKQLKDIAQYVVDNFGSKTAQKTIDEIQKKTNGLLLFPESGNFDKNLSTGKYVVRHVAKRPNLIYYVVDGEVIIIMAIAHEKQSPATVSKMIFRFLEHYESMI